MKDKKIEVIELFQVYFKSRAGRSAEGITQLKWRMEDFEEDSSGSRTIFKTTYWPDVMVAS